ncbi:Alpha/Beta hydrolase protein [Kalaharituber pfeilii]|nr:Alpha/Beta hydrolase protein [Kalaharituber pfeilii]
MSPSLSSFSHHKNPYTPSPSRHKNSFDNLSARLGDSFNEAKSAAALAASVTRHDTVILTSDGHRLPGIPLPEAQQLNASRLEQEERHQKNNEDAESRNESDTATFIPLMTTVRPSFSPVNVPRAPAYTHPLFPPLPLYGPTTPLRKVQAYVFRVISGILSICFLTVIVTGAIIKYIPVGCRRWYLRNWKNEDPDKDRPFYQIELERAKKRGEAERTWEEAASIERDFWRGRAAQDVNKKQSEFSNSCPTDEEKIDAEISNEDACTKDASVNTLQGRKPDSIPREGGRDKLVCDIGYYARRVGLDIEEYKVETEDGFLILLQRVYDPRDPPLDVNTVEDGLGESTHWNKKGRRKYPVLLIHGLLQSSGAFCVNDEDSLAFFLCKSGYDVWLGNNRCGRTPEHTLLTYSDPRMWAWNIRQMGILDLPAFINHILTRTGFPKLALIAHSQGTAEAFVALAREQRPELGSKISIFCALAPAVYAGKLVEEMYFKFMEIVSPSMFRVIFGIHAFIPMMMWFQQYLPGRLYGKLGYRVFSYLFKWSDLRWDRGLRERFFRFSPVYVSAESMRWWLGRECFATQKCILATRTEEQNEDDKELRREQNGLAEKAAKQGSLRSSLIDERLGPQPEPQTTSDTVSTKSEESSSSEDLLLSGPWYNELFPPLALWVCGSDDLVDGKRFLKRLDKGREPYVRVVHQSVIDEYEHLDVLWAIDSIQKVGWEVRDIVWKIVEEEMEKAREEHSRLKAEIKEQQDKGESWWKNVVVPEGVGRGIRNEEKEYTGNTWKVKTSARIQREKRLGNQKYSSAIPGS